jgi:hypothetical protein
VTVSTVAVVNDVDLTISELTNAMMALDPLLTCLEDLLLVEYDAHGVLDHGFFAAAFLARNF